MRWRLQSQRETEWQIMRRREDETTDSDRIYMKSAPRHTHPTPLEILRYASGDAAVASGRQDRARREGTRRDIEDEQATETQTQISRL